MIPCYFYIVMYCGYIGLKVAKDVDAACTADKMPTFEIFIGIEVGVFALWLLSMPLFLIISHILGYESKYERDIDLGFEKTLKDQESVWRIDFLDYAKQDAQLYQISMVNFFMTLACMIYVPQTKSNGTLMIARTDE